jgi:hypothetical protein
MWWKISKIILGSLLSLIALLCMCFAPLMSNHAILSDEAIRTTEWISLFFLFFGVFIIYMAARKNNNL